MGETHCTGRVSGELAVDAWSKCAHFNASETASSSSESEASSSFCCGERYCRSSSKEILSRSTG